MFFKTDSELFRSKYSQPLCTNHKGLHCWWPFINFLLAPPSSKVSCLFIFSDVLHHLYSVFVHFVSWRGILLFPGFSMDGVGDTLFSIIILNFVCTVFVSSFSAMHLKFSCTLFFSYVYHLFLFPVFFLPNLIFFLLFFPQWNFSSSCTFFYYT